LESVGYGKSALKSSSGSDDVGSMRRAEYEHELELLNARFEAQMVVMPGEHESALQDLRHRYADVNYEPGVAARLIAKRDIEGFVLSSGVDYKIQEKLLVKLAADFDDCEEEIGVYH